VTLLRSNRVHSIIAYAEKCSTLELSQGACVGRVGGESEGANCRFCRTAPDRWQAAEVEKRVHQRYTALMSLQLDGVASQSEQLELGRHLAECPECAAIWEQWQALDRLLLAAPSAIPSSGLVLDTSLIVGVEAPPRRGVGWLLPAALFLGVLCLVRNCLAVVLVFRLGGHYVLEMGRAAAPFIGTLSRLCCAPARAPAILIALVAVDLALLAVLCIVMVGSFVVLMHSSQGRSQR
jgi:predicted anti-sigma-YlaC factor YlaD